MRTGTVFEWSDEIQDGDSTFIHGKGHGATLTIRRQRHVWGAEDGESERPGYASELTLKMGDLTWKRDGCSLEYQGGKSALERIRDREEKWAMRAALMVGSVELSGITTGWEAAEQALYAPDEPFTYTEPDGWVHRTGPCRRIRQWLWDRDVRCFKKP